MVEAWIESQKTAYPALAERYQTLGDLHTQKCVPRMPGFLAPSRPRPAALR